MVKHFPWRGQSCLIQLKNVKLINVKQYIWLFAFSLLINFRNILPTLCFTVLLKWRLNHHFLKYLKEMTIKTLMLMICNYRIKEDCPLQGKCLTKNIVYRAIHYAVVNEKIYNYHKLSMGNESDTNVKILST